MNLDWMLFEYYHFRLYHFNICLIFPETNHGVPNSIYNFATQWAGI